MSSKEDWRAIVASSLNWEQAHSSMESALRGIPPEVRGKRPTGFPHSAWELLEHIRITQHDLLDFVQNPEYEEKLKSPDALGHWLLTHLFRLWRGPRPE